MTHIKYLRLHQLTTTCGYDLDLWSSYLVLVDANENKIILEATDFQSIFKGRAEYCVELLFLAPVVPGVQGGTPIEHSMRQIEPADCDVPEKLHKSGCVKQRECVHHTFFRRMCAAIHILRWRRKKGALVKASVAICIYSDGWLTPPASVLPVRFRRHQGISKWRLIHCHVYSDNIQVHAPFFQAHVNIKPICATREEQMRTGSLALCSVKPQPETFSSILNNKLHLVILSWSLSKCF